MEGEDLAAVEQVSIATLRVPMPHAHVHAWMDLPPIPQFGIPSEAGTDDPDVVQQLIMKNTTAGLNGAEVSAGASMHVA